MKSFYPLLYFMILVSLCSCKSLGVKELFLNRISVDIEKTNSVVLTTSDHNIKNRFGWIVIGGNGELIDYGISDAKTESVKVPCQSYGQHFSLQMYDVNADFYATVVMVKTLQDSQIRKKISQNIAMPKDIASVLSDIEKHIKEVSKEFGASAVTKIKVGNKEYKTISPNTTTIKEDLKGWFQIGTGNTWTEPGKNFLWSKLVHIHTQLEKAHPNPLSTYGHVINRHFAARKQFSTLTAKSTLIHVPSEHALCPAAHISIYPSTLFNIEETAANWADRFSIDIGLAGKSMGNTASDEFDETDTKILLGAGINLIDEFSIQFGCVAQFHKGKVKPDFYWGASIDILKVANLLSKSKTGD